MYEKGSALEYEVVEASCLHWLLRYANDLRTTFSAERRRAEELHQALDAVERAYTATVRAA